MASAIAHATSSLSFEADGYLIDIVVGYSSKPVVSKLNIVRPGGKEPEALPMQMVVVEIFDAQQKVLVLDFKNPGNSGLPESFRLTVRHDVGILKMGEKSLAGSFSWGM